MSNSQHDQRRRPRVLLLAYSCRPNHGSEPGAGWNRVCRIAKYCDAWVLSVASRFDEAVRDHVREHGNEHQLHFEFVPKNRGEKLLACIPGMYYLSYNLWHRRALRVARRLHEQIQFDLVHQITFSAFREPGYLWKLDAPFVWGPVSGTQNFPWRFLAQEGLGTALIEGLRTVVNHFQLRFSPRVCRAARRASAIMAATTTNQRDLAVAQRVTATLLSDVGTLQVAAEPRVCLDGHGPLRIFWSGEFRGLKALSLLIEALAQLPPDVSYELRVAGKGWKKGRWRRLARRTGVDRHTRWLGWLPYDEALRQYEWADIFVFTSLRDTTGTVVLEALAAGLPVICMDHQGVHDVVTEHCGIKIPVTTPGDAIANISQAIASLARSPDERQRLSRGALQRAKQLSWHKVGEQMADVYRRVLGGRFVIEPSAAAAPDSPAACRPRNAPNIPVGEQCESVVLPGSRWPLLSIGGGKEVNSVVRVSGRHSASPTAFTSQQSRYPLKELGDRAAGRIGVGLGALLGSRAGKRVGILAYHRNTGHHRGLASPTQNVPPERLRSQLAGLLARGFTVWPLRKILACCRSNPESLPPRVLAVTFDDGYATTWLNAWPVLRQLNVPATVFLATAYLDSSEPFPFDTWGVAVRNRAPAEAYRPLTTEECRRMIEDGLIDVGAHTHTHEDFRGRPEAFRRDLQQCMEIIAAQFGLRDMPYAFPWGVTRLGFATSAFRAAARQAGVICGLTMQSALIEPASDPFAWGRFNVHCWDTDATLAAKLQGWYSWAPRLKQRLLSAAGLDRSRPAPPRPDGNGSIGNGSIDEPEQRYPDAEVHKDCPVERIAQ